MVSTIIPPNCDVTLRKKNLFCVEVMSATEQTIVVTQPGEMPAVAVKSEPVTTAADIKTSTEDSVNTTEEVVTTTPATATAPQTQAAIVEGEDGEQQIYIIQTADGEQIPVEGAEVVVTEDVSVIETVSALEQLSRGQHVVTEGGELLQVYEEVVLPDGTSAAKLDADEDDAEAAGVVGNLTLPTTPLPLNTVTTTIAGHTDPTTGQEFHICRICNQFVPADLLATHNTQAHGHIRDLTCMDCGKLFKSKRSLFGHRKEKHSGMLEVHSCPECGKSFGRKSNLKAHRESLHYGKKFPCVYCERIFTNRSSMNQHIKKTHQTLAPNAVGPDGQQTVILHPQTTVINI